MNRTPVVVAISIACAPGFAADPRAQGPPYDCAKAKGEVQKLICEDASLAQLDRRLDETYNAASAKAKGRQAAQLRTEQRGWTKGRNDCWKANGQPTWITPTWTVSTVKGCVEAQTRLRMTELQSVWRLVPPKTVFYVCQNNPANEVVANFFATDPATIRLERGDRTVTMWLVGAAGTGNYEGQNVSFVHAGSEARVNWLNTSTGTTEELQCKAR